jgi:WD40 repeat protein
MASARAGLRWATKIQAATAFCLVGAAAGTGLYFGNLAYVTAGDKAARAAAALAPRGATKIATITPPGGGTFSSALFSTDGTLIAAAGGTSQQGDVYIFNAKTGQYETTISVPRGDTVLPLGITPDDSELIAVDEGSSASSAWNIYDFTLATEQHGPGDQVPPEDFAVNDDGSVEAEEASNDKSIDIWDLLTAVQTGRWANPFTDSPAVASLDVSSDGSKMLISDEDGKAYVLSTSSGKTIAVFHYTYKASGSTPVLAPDGRSVYIPSNGSGPAQIWDVNTDANVTPAGPQWPRADNGVLYSTDGSVVMTSPAGADTCDLWNVALGTHIAHITIPGSNNWDVEALGPAGNSLLFSSDFAKNGDFVNLDLYTVP